MRPPENVIIGPHVVRVQATNDPSLFGQYLSAKALIEYDPKQAPTQAQDTILHEVLHAIMDVSGLAHAALGGLGSKREEQVVRTLAPYLLDVIKRNPLLVRYLRG